MKPRLIAALLFLITFTWLHAPSAQASIQPIVAVDTFFSALDSGDHEAAVATFAPDAVATLLRGETYQGPDGMLELVRLLGRPGRYHTIVQAEMIGDTVTAVVEISDHGIPWGEQKITFEVKGGKLHTFRERAFRLLLG